ncbi:MAG: hypothetical protein EBY89_07045 [Actinobacteria bacterium]|nr:hypothetical protein [Actinomycetota bacterium]
MRHPGLRRQSYPPRVRWRSRGGVRSTNGGSSVLGWQRHGIAVGSPADFIALETNSVRLASFDPRRAAAHIVYSAAPADVRDVWVGGKQIVENFVHRAIDDVPASLRSAIAAVVTL